jgi:phospholipid/cholesterol/gamma-HCH transport system ATP-binding protein
MIYHGNMIWTGQKDKIDQSGSEYIDQFINGKAEGPIKMEILKG